MHVKSIARLALNSYRLEDFQGNSVEISLQDGDLARFARMLGFDKFYPDLEDLVDNVDLWVGPVLVAIHDTPVAVSAAPDTTAASQ